MTYGLIGRVELAHGLVDGVVVAHVGEHLRQDCLGLIQRLVLLLWRLQVAH